MRVFARDVWGKDESGGLVWAILTLCAIITDLGATFHSAHFPAISTSDESCSITLRLFAEDQVAQFRSLHPCARRAPSNTAA